MLSSETLKNQLVTLGLREGDTLMVHASLRKLGPVVGGASTVIRSILEVIGQSGTMLMVLGSRDGDIFDARSSPSDPEMGVLAEEFRKYPGVDVNDHPAARFAAIGANSQLLLNPAPLHDYYGESSVLQRFVNGGGKVLRLSPNIDTTTVTHYAEYLARVSPKRRVRRRYVTKAEGEIFIDSLDDCDGIQDWPKGDYFGQILIDYIARKSCSTSKVGDCTAELIEAMDLVNFAIDWMELNLGGNR